ncbi:hypothetical protein, partial [Novosphingobium sp. 9U]|uniref:hypothetical protein n=1 Tax=Novosphingobium sp. 9U TaxID=2653158 RepID=UPI001F1CABE4
FHRDIKTNILVHGCSPLMLGPVTNREPVLHHTGEQPPASAPIVLCGSAPRDYTMFILNKRPLSGIDRAG